MRFCDATGFEVADFVSPSNRDVRQLLAEYRVLEVFGKDATAPIFITGKLASIVHKALGCGKTFLPSGALWLAARDLMASRDVSVQSLACIEISASGYTLIGVGRDGKLKNDLLVVNPRCGAGTGINLDRVLQKLGIRREEVDKVLADYLGASGSAKRAGITTRADRCGVFSSSATISDKNQGIPLSVALATTLKSEVLKTCRKLPPGFDEVVLIGRFFHWQFARDCAEDFLREQGVRLVTYDPDNTHALDALSRLVARVGIEKIAMADPALSEEPKLGIYPSFSVLKQAFESEFRYLRRPQESPNILDRTGLTKSAVHIGLDVGSTMAKIVVADDDAQIFFLNAYSNSGDTVETIKHIFDDFRAHGIGRLEIRSIGITGSARYQVQEALSRIYPTLTGRISVLVENYAHARGSIDQARQHLNWLKEQGVADLNKDFCILVDIGGEDTKISTIALAEAELFNNAMNVKCSAGTGSLMDSLSSLFGIEGAREASRIAFSAKRGLAINATCAVFLMENAQKLQAQGIPQDEILASASWAVVENMARTLWNQVELPRNAVVLLHGQTMLSDPLPLAVTARLQQMCGGTIHALVPPFPGHRACFGLVRSMAQAAPPGSDAMSLGDFVAARFEKRIIQCKGAACDDAQAVCNRTSLKCRSAEGKQFSFTLGGCTAINELLARAKNKKDVAEKKTPHDAYKQIWDFIDQRLPRTELSDRIVIARSFVVSEWAGFLARLFSGLGLPVHVDNVRESDLTDAQTFFNIDSCAPHMGAVGQYRRLAREPHGMILVPQIEKLPTDGKSLGRTCTLNQGGTVVAKNLADLVGGNARFHVFNLNLERLDAGFICDQLFDCFRPLFDRYGLKPTRDEFTCTIAKAIDHHLQLKDESAELAASLIEEALRDGFQVAVVVGREYILNPGIYDSHVRRLLRDKHMVAIPSYVLDVDLDESFSGIYWRNPHFIVTVLNAVAHRMLHRRVHHPRLAAVLRRIEEQPDDALLPVVQISTFCCGPDSVTSHLVAEIMKTRPFLLIQSDAVIKELAHLENRVNTYVRQLELGLHGKLEIGGREPFEVHVLEGLENQERLNRETDVIYIPTMSDNRAITSVLRAAGFSCIDNYQDDHDLQRLIKQGRGSAGDAVCAPLAGVYGDLERAIEDFTARRRNSDPQMAGKSRLMFFNNKGTGPCRQGQYAEVHKLLSYRKLRQLDEVNAAGELDGSGVLRFLIANEDKGYDFGVEEWALMKIYQGAILQGVLHQLLFSGGAVCGDYEEYLEFLDDYRKLKIELYRILENFKGPGLIARSLVGAFGGFPGMGSLVKYFSYNLSGADLALPIKRFSARWLKSQQGTAKRLHIHVSGEVYMRIAQGEAIYRTLLANLGFRRFDMELAPVWSYLEYLVEESMENARESIRLAEAGKRRAGGDIRRDEVLRANRDKLFKLKLLGWMLRNLLAKPLYRAAGIQMPKPAPELMLAAKEILPTLRPIGELAPYVGEALTCLRQGTDLFLNVAPSSCMVSAMGEVVTPKLQRIGASAHSGHIQQLFSAEGEITEELLTLAMLKAIDPERYFLKAA